MVNFSNIWAVARMERRHTRRLARYWVFLAVAYLFGLGGYFYYSVLHALFSSLSASVGMIGPRYLMGAIALYYLTGFVLGIVFLGFDVRARDVRDGIVEVLDARPLTNFELVTGRFVALFLSAWIPIVVLVVLIQGLGFLLPLLGSPVGSTVEPLSLISFAVLMAVPGLAFAIGLVFVITLLVRHRLIAALLAIAAIVGLYWAMFTVPGTLAGYFDFLGISTAAFPSDFVPGLWGVPGGWLHRAGVLAMGFGLVGMAAAIHPRLDARKSWTPIAGSAALVVAGLAAVAVVVQMRVAEAAGIEQWRAAHEARAAEPVADIVAIDGTLSIEPGRNLAADLVLELQAPAQQGLSRVLLTLNPGFGVDEVTTADGSALRAEHANGLLDIALERPLAPGERTSLRLRYGGRPNTGFGYLDSTLELETATLAEAQVGILGYQRGIFDRRYVALVPGIRWLPAAGVDVGRDDPRTRRTDYFRVALDVELPSTWLAAGPGKRQTLSSAGERTTFRFAPQPAVPEVALMAAELTSFATEIDGVTFEVLVHPDHDRNFEVLAESRAEVEQWIAERLEIARDAGLAYPFDAFTAVEVPQTLRSYKGGWRLDTALAPPAMMLLREASFPTSRFDFDVIAVFGTRNFDQEGGKPRIDRDRLVNFFGNDLSGGNILAGAARSFFVHRTSGAGPEAIALDFVLEDLATLLVSGRRSFFSAHMFTNINQAVVSVMNNLQGATAISEAVIRSRTGRGDVWNAALETPLSEIDPLENPQRALDTLTLKGGNLAEVIRDRLGLNAIGQLLAQLVGEHAGRSFSLADFVAAGESVSPGIGPLIQDWIGSTALPGFIVRSVEQYRLPDDENGASRYQLLVRLGNEEPVVGFARVSWAVPGPGGGGSGPVLAERGQNAPPVGQVATPVINRSDAIRFEGHSAVEFGVVLSVPATNVRVLPYLSLNRADFVAAILPPGQPERRNVEPIEGAREIPFELGRDPRIVADDLDEGFAIVTDAAADDFRLGEQGDAAEELDEGLPVATTALPSRWSRRNGPAAWGRYRHTFASIRAGEGTARAVLPATIPTAGTWELEIHLPPFLLNFASANSRWSLEIVSADGRETVDYDAATAAAGWNLIGEYRLPAGEVRVEISDRAAGGVIIADAVAWSPVRTFGSEAATAR
jgi:ABC-type transport system involved in multi-copper enzyme maturation permease subunit